MNKKIAIIGNGFGIGSLIAKTPTMSLVDAEKAFTIPENKPKLIVIKSNVFDVPESRFNPIPRKERRKAEREAKKKSKEK